jgi:hypothetical protein
VARSAGVVLAKEFDFLEQPPRLRHRREASRLLLDWRSHPALTKAGIFHPKFDQIRNVIPRLSKHSSNFPHPL